MTIISNICLLSIEGHQKENWRYVSTKSDDSHPLDFVKSKRESKSALIATEIGSVDILEHTNQAATREQDVAAAPERAHSTDSSCEDDDYLNRTQHQPIQQYSIIENGIRIANQQVSKTTQTGAEEKDGKRQLERVAQFILGAERKENDSKPTGNAFSKLFKF